MPSHGVQIIYTPPSGVPFQSNKSYTADGDTEVDTGAGGIAGNASDAVISIAIDVSQVKSIGILSDQALVLKTNSHGSPADTLTLVANRPYEWDTDSYNTLKFGTDVTSIHVDNPSPTAARLQISVCYDSTL